MDLMCKQVMMNKSAASGIRLADHPENEQAQCIDKAWVWLQLGQSGYKT